MKINWLWDTRLTEARVKRILQNEKDPRFYIYAEKLFSRVTDPKDVFRYVSKDAFYRNWPSIKHRIEKDAWVKDKAVFWQTIYEHIEKQIEDVPERLSIAQQIKNSRVKMGYTQEEMAEKLGVIQQYVSKLEAGSENLTIDTLKRIAQVLGKKLTIQFG